MDYLVIGAYGKEYGPVDLAGLAEWAKADRVRPQSAIKEVASGRMITADQVPGLFRPLAGPDPAAGPDWSQPPGFYSRPAAPQKVYVYGMDPSRYVIWAILDACLAILFAFTWRTIGPVMFCGLSFFYSIRAVIIRHKLCWVALGASAASLIVVFGVFIFRAARMF